jgi:predicted ester cyclase
MSAERNKQTIIEYLEAFRTLPITQEKMDRYISLQDEELRKHIEVFQAGVPGYVLDPHDIIAEGDKVVVRFTFRGRHTGELMGLAPSGNELNVSGIIIYALENDQIINHWMEFDVPSFMQQIQATSTVSPEAMAN